MAKVNSLNNDSSTFTVDNLLTVTAGGLTVTAGNTTLTPIKSTAATGVVTVSSSGVLAEVETGAAGTILVGTSTSPKFLTAGTSGYFLKAAGAAADPVWTIGSSLALGTTQYAVQVGGASGTLSSLAVGTAGQILIGGTATTNPSWLAAGTTGQTLMAATSASPGWTSSPSFGGTVTAGTGLTATTGAITATSGDVVITAGALVLSAQPNSLIKCGTDVWFSNYGAQSYPTTPNLFLGLGCGNSTMTSLSNANIAIGSSSLNAANSYALDNIAIGSGVLSAIVGHLDGASGFQNVGIGSLSLANLVGNSNTSYLGSNNICLGYRSGYAFTTTETSNICINSEGVIGDAYTLRIGHSTGASTQGQLNAAYIAGITGITVTGAAVLCSTSGQLGTVASSLRFKENVEDMGSVSEDIYKLRPVKFNYIKNPEMGQQVGLIAEEVLEVMPNLVIIGLDGLPETVKYHELPVLLLNEIIKLKKRIEVLEAKCL